MFFKPHELIALLVVGALLLIIATGTLVKERFFAEREPRLAVLSNAAFELAEVPEKLGAWVSSIGKSPFELNDRFPHQSGFRGQTNDDERYLLLSSYDGDIKKTVVDMIDLRTFQTVHRWAPEQQTGTLGYDITKQSHRELRLFYADVMTKNAIHASLLPQGNLAVSLNDGSISKLNVCSHPQWQALIPDGIPTNTSLELDDHGNIWVAVAQKYTPIEPSDADHEEMAPSTNPFFDNLVLQLSPSGEVIFSKSITDILVENELSHFLFGMREILSPDPMRIVDIQPALADGTHWQKDDVLISLKNLSMILLYRPSTDTVLWHSIGRTNFQSDVEFAFDSSVAIFDNNTPAYFKQNAKSVYQEDLGFKMVNGHNKILVYDFATDQYSYHLDDALRTYKVRTAVRGQSQVLPNGDLFVEETEYGRLLYFNSDGSLLWSYVNRAEDGSVYATGSSRILYRDSDLAMVRNFLTGKDQLLAECK